MAARDDQHSDEWLAVGVEISGRGQRVALVTSNGRVLESAHAIGHDATAAGTIDTTCILIDNVLAGKRHPPGNLHGIGVAFGGPVDVERGVTLRSHRVPGFEHFPLVSVLEERLGMRTALENSARCAAVGELALGAGRGARDMVYLHLGTGVGGAIVIDGKLQHGGSMTAGELGHMVVAAVDGEGAFCSCGKPGHLEAYASAPAIVERMRLRLAGASADAKAKWLASPGITVGRIFELCDEDPEARTIVDETVRVIGLACANLVTALNPDVVVLGGEVALAGASLASSVRARIRQYAFDPAAREVKVTTSQLGPDAPIVGAVMLTRR